MRISWKTHCKRVTHVRAAAAAGVDPAVFGKPPERPRKQRHECTLTACPPQATSAFSPALPRKPPQPPRPPDPQALDPASAGPVLEDAPVRTRRRLRGRASAVARALIERLPPVILDGTLDDAKLVMNAIRDQHFALPSVCSHQQSAPDLADAAAAALRDGRFSAARSALEAIVTPPPPLPDRVTLASVLEDRFGKPLQANSWSVSSRPPDMPTPPAPIAPSQSGSPDPTQPQKQPQPSATSTHTSDAPHLTVERPPETNPPPAPPIHPAQHACHDKQARVTPQPDTALQPPDSRILAATIRALTRARPGDGAGPDGWRVGHLKEAFQADPEVAKVIALLVQHLIASTTVPVWMQLCRLVLLPKSASDIRPIAIGQAMWRISARVLLSLSRDRVLDFLRADPGITEVTFGEPHGCQQATILLDAWCAEAKQGGCAVFGCDIARAYDSVSWDALRKSDSLIFGPQIASLLVSLRRYLCTSDGTRYAPDRGVNQGCPLAAARFAGAIHLALRAVRVSFPGVQFLVYADDVYFRAPDSKMADEAYSALVKELSLCGLTLKLAKCFLLAAPSPGSPHWLLGTKPWVSLSQSSTRSPPLRPPHALMAFVRPSRQVATFATPPLCDPAFSVVSVPPSSS